MTVDVARIRQIREERECGFHEAKRIAVKEARLARLNRLKGAVSPDHVLFDVIAFLEEIVADDA